MTPRLAESLLVGLGGLHFLQLPVTSVLMQKTFGSKHELSKLSPLLRRIVRLFVWGLVLLLTGLGALVAAYAAEVASSGFGRALCLLLGGLFAARVLAHTSLFELWPPGRANRRTYFALGCLYSTLASGYLAVGLSTP